ncbi:MAG: formylglycine-generating enzyme family protein [Sandaracinaceae bacterium]
MRRIWVLCLLACQSPAAPPSPSPAAEPPPPEAAVELAPSEPAPSEPTPPEPEPVAAPPAQGACPPEDGWPEGMACVPGGSFTVGTADGDPDDGPPGDASVSTFFYDRVEVDNAHYEACLEAGACPMNRRYRHFRAALQPIVGVSWYGARDYCAWVGSRLPTDAEFEYAARGPDGTVFPWGDETASPCERAVVKTRAGEGCGTEVTAEVGSRPAGYFGLHDLAGNVHEWTADHWAPCLRGCARECGDACFGEDPRGPCGGDEACPGYPLRSVRGGSWFWPLDDSRGAARRGAVPANEGGHRFGFRCARDL